MESDPRALPTCRDSAPRPGGWNGKGLSPKRPPGRSALGEENSSREERPCPRWPLPARAWGRAESPYRPGLGPPLEGEPGVWRRAGGQREREGGAEPGTGSLCLSAGAGAGKDPRFKFLAAKFFFVFFFFFPPPLPPPKVWFSERQLRRWQPGGALCVAAAAAPGRRPMAAL